MTRKLFRKKAQAHNQIPLLPKLLKVPKSVIRGTYKEKSVFIWIRILFRNFVEHIEGKVFLKQSVIQPFLQTPKLLFQVTLLEMETLEKLKPFLFCPTHLFFSFQNLNLNVRSRK